MKMKTSTNFRQESEMKALISVGQCAQMSFKVVALMTFAALSYFEPVLVRVRGAERTKSSHMVSAE